MKVRLRVHQQGLALLEVMLVLVVALVIIIYSIQYYATYKKSSDVGLLEASANQAMMALNEYYYGNCNNTSSPITEVSLATLYQAGLLPQPLNNPWGSFFVNVINMSTDTNNPFYLLQVGVTIMNQNLTPGYAQQLAGFIRGALNGDAATGTSTIVTWTRLPTHDTADIASSQWVMNQGPGQTIMPGRYVTGMNTGMNSSFWVMDNGAEMFSRQQQLTVNTITGQPLPDSACPN